MRLLIQRSPDPVPYRGAYFRIAPAEGVPARASVILAPAADHLNDAEALSQLLGLVLALGDPPAGGAPIRQHWLSAELELGGKMGTELAPHHTREATRLAGRIRTEWDRFLANCFARLRGEPRGTAHFAWVGGAWDPDQPSMRVTNWPPLDGQTLPPLE